MEFKIHIKGSRPYFNNTQPWFDLFRNSDQLQNSNLTLAEEEEVVTSVVW